MIPPIRPWVLQCACKRIRRIIRGQWLICDDCDQPIPTSPTSKEAR